MRRLLLAALTLALFAVSASAQIGAPFIPADSVSQRVGITGNAAGTTGAVVGTLAAQVGRTTYICGFEVDAVGGTAAVSPITVAGVVGTSMVFRGSSTAAGGPVAQQRFMPCIPASATDTAITVTTTADGTATAVDVNSWGYQF